MDQINQIPIESTKLCNILNKALDDVVFPFFKKVI